MTTNRAVVSLEDLRVGTRVVGVVPDEAVELLQVDHLDSIAATLTYRTRDGRTGQEVVYRGDEGRLSVEVGELPWPFDADGDLFRLASEALRLRLAYLFDPYLAVHTSNLEPLPHQISAVYGEMLTRQPLRFLLADDPGAGKTIMAGLLIKELIARGDLRRCLVVAPGSLVEQWQDELWAKLGLAFEIVAREAIEASRSGNPFAEKRLVIARLDHLSRNDDVLAKLSQTEWDLVIVDEAHKMSAHYFGSELKETRRYRLGRLLGQVTRHLLLMTATPHSGKEEDFQLFLALLDPDRFEGKQRAGARTADAEGLMRRLVKERLLKFDGRPLFPERIASTVSYELSPPERRLYEAVTAYVREEMNRAQRLSEQGEGRRGMIVGFALTILQRRLASSPEAIYRSLERRRERLERRLAEERAGVRALSGPGPAPASIADDDLDELDDRPEDEARQIEEALVDQASAAATAAELEAEIATLRRLEALARELRASGADRKWEELSRLLQDPVVAGGGRRRKLIVFTEHRDTLNYLAGRIRTLLGSAEAVEAIHGGMRREERRRAQETFLNDPKTSLLVATDAAGEGVNLQRAHLLVNYDLPWNPNRIEQRFGRIHRIGQSEVCHMWNLVAADTREGYVFQRLFQKLERQQRALRGQVFDVLGQVFVDEPLRDLLVEAIRYGDQPEVRARLDRVVDAAAGENLRRALAERALVSDVLSPVDVERIRERMEEAEARRLQPHFVRSFFLAAFEQLGGRISAREAGRYEISHVPVGIRDAAASATRPVLRRYERVTFEKALIELDERPPAELLAPGHPLLDTVVSLTLARHGDLLRRGAILVAEADEGEEPRALVYLEDAVQSAEEADGRRRVVSRRVQFVELGRDGEARTAGSAPHLDLRALRADEAELVAELPQEPWLADAKRRATEYAIRTSGREHLEEVRRRSEERLRRTAAAVRERLTREIAYWDRRAEELKAQELAGKKPRLNSGRARQRADELQARLDRRLSEVERERQLSLLPPTELGAALVVPRGWLERRRGERQQEPTLYARETERVERLAVEAVLAAERRIGRQPREMPRNNPGFDILSRDPRGDRYLFIEVKGRVRGAPTVSVTKNEILTALNKPDDFLLALVEVDGEETEVRYLARPFHQSEESLFGVTSINFAWDEHWQRAKAPAPPERPAPEHWIEVMVERIASEFAPERIVLFGSRARGEGDEESDVDLLVVLPEVADRGQASVEIRRALADLPVAKDIVVATPDELERRGDLVGTVLRSALREGRVIYARA